MKINDLAKLEALGFDVTGTGGAVYVANKKGTVISAGPITKQPGTAAFRVILVAFPGLDLTGYNGCLVVHNEIFPNYEINASLSHPFYTQGDYFPFPADSADIIRAVKTFHERLGNTIESINSLFREPE